MAIIDKIQLSGTVYTIGNETTTAVTSASTDNEIPTAKAVYDAIPQGGGGKAIEAGTNISVTTGETADTINCTLLISAGTGTNALIYNSTTNVASGYCSNAEGYSTIASGNYSFVGGTSFSEAEGEASFAFGYSVVAIKDASAAFGKYTITKNPYEFGCGILNKSVKGIIGSEDSGSTLFSVGNGKNDTRHNAFEIRQNGDIYIVDTNDTSTTNYYEKPMIKLQDALGGGGGSSYTAGDGIDITNDVISVTGKVDTSTYNTYTAATDTALREKANTATTYTKTETDNAITAATSTKQDTLVSGTNIKTINNQSILGEGNITIEGGSGGVNVVQTTGTSTADVMSQDAVTTQLNGKGDAIGIDMVGSPKKKVTFQMRRGGVNGTIISSRDLTLGRGLVYGEEGFDTLSTSGLVETSAITTSVTSSSTDAQVPSAKAVYDQLDGLKLKKITQSEYDALSPNYDANTLYVING